jgi:glycosyltransferase involved in cell wall biosynthesis
MYTRPQHDRNAFELAIATAKKLKTALGENIEIVSAGSEWDPRDMGVEGIVENKGLLSYEDTAKLYRECNFGLIFMFTKHPSYITLELMASGAIVVTNYNDANEWLLKDGENCIIVEPSPTCIVEKIRHLIDNPEVQRVIRDNAIKAVSSVDWNSEIEKIYRFITQSL